jgi:two-component sensor histidine kinase
MYHLALSHISLNFGIFFLLNSIIGLFHSSKINTKRSRCHSFMSLSMAIYSLLFFVNLYIINEKISNAILMLHWIFAYLGVYFYFCAVEFYLNKNLKKLLIPKVLFLIIPCSYLLAFLSFLFTGRSLFFQKIPSHLITLYSSSSFITSMGSEFAIFLGYIGIVVIYYSSIIIWKELNKSSENEWPLKLGIILCLVTGLNDTIMALAHFKYSLPVFYIGCSIESIRFMLHSKTVTTKKVKSLNRKVDQLSSIAQYGMITASITHDIRNHLQVINLLFGTIKDCEDSEKIEKIKKHTKAIESISYTYTDLFKKNVSSSIDSTSLQDVLKNVMELIVDKIKYFDINFEIECDKDFVINCNETEISLCFVNIINNAIDAISDIETRWIKVKCNKNHKEVFIIDSGPGIEESKVRQCFNLNYSSKKNEEGTGIGLAIVREILAKDNHELEYVPNQKNTTFKIKFN